MSRERIPQSAHINVDENIQRRIMTISRIY